MCLIVSLTSGVEASTSGVLEDEGNRAGQCPVLGDDGSQMRRCSPSEIDTDVPSNRCFDSTYLQIGSLYPTAAAGHR